jgi:hypothetical protein
MDLGLKGRHVLALAGVTKSLGGRHIDDVIGGPSIWTARRHLLSRTASRFTVS